MKWMKTLRWLLLLAGVLLVGVGIWTMFTPWSGLMSLAVVISLAMLLSGVLEIVVFCAGKGRFRSGWMLVGGILSALLGLWLLIGHGYEALAVAIPFVFGIWVLSSGITRSVGSFELKSAEVEGWGWMLALGILEMLLGVLLLFSPVMSAAVCSALVSVMFFAQGVNDILLFSNITRAKKFAEHIFGDFR